MTECHTIASRGLINLGTSGFTGPSSGGFECLIMLHLRMQRPLWMYQQISFA